MFDSILNSSTHWSLLIVGLLAGFLLIIYGGNYFVESAIWIAKITHIPQMIIGATIVSIGTTLPEVFVSFTAAANGQADMSVGNAAGSIVFNAGIILAIAMVATVSKVDRKEFVPKIIILTIALIFLTILSFIGIVSILSSLILVIIFAVFMIVNIMQASKSMKFEQPTLEAKLESTGNETTKEKKAWVMIALFFVGALGITFGAQLLIASVSGLAIQMGVSIQIVSLTIVAMGTSLPELVTTITAIRKKSNSISLGNIIGANILNATMILGGSGIILGAKNIPITFSGAEQTTIIITMILALLITAIISIPIIISKRTYKWQGYSLIGIYSCYLGYMIYSIT